MHNSTDTAKNRLQHEKSPYLLQHAANPVDWHPWGDEALSKARNENKPIFISIGYSTCHWCHVMAHESFEDAEVAERLNRNFVSIKVDREERPDIDAGYMLACQLMNGHGGWPLNLFLSPEGKPFYALTYAPRNTRGQYPGFIQIIDKIAELWEQQPANLIAAGEQLSEIILQMENATEHCEPQELLLEEAAKSYRESFDPQHGGFGNAPKFPQPHNASLLLRLADRFGNDDLRLMAHFTLEKIEQGGITDQLGGGLHRYSVDDRWLVPHFEKMLYDQALITEAYLDAWQASGEPLYADAARHILDYVLRELQHSEGGFYCGEDADSEGAEGTYYLWTLEELDNSLTPEEKNLFSSIYNLSAAGNFEGRNIPHRTADLAELAARHQLDESGLTTLLDAMKSRLLAVRNQRPHPHLDDKILSGWNGLMIAALARAGRLLGEDRYLSAASRAAGFIASRMLNGDRLMRRYRDGEVAVEAFHEDYAYLAHGLIELFEANFVRSDLELALWLTERCETLFGDSQGGYFDASVTFADGLGRGRSKQDGAIPAAASVTAGNLVRLARWTGRQHLEEQARQLLSRHLQNAAEHPTGHAYLLQVLDLLISEPLSLVIVLPDETPLPPEWLQPIREFRPNLTTLIDNEPGMLADLIPFAEGKTAQGGTVTAWLCTQSGCLAPVASAARLADLLEHHAPLKTLSR